MDASPAGRIAIVRDPAPEGIDWDALLAFLHAAFAYMHDRIDPPSSLLAMDAAALRAKAASETLFVALDDGALVGCLFARPKDGALYVGKVAVDPRRQGAGVGRALFAAAEALARELALPVMELETRIELSENHAIFGALGFAIVSQHAHPGFARTTYVRMRAGCAAPN